MIEYSIYCICNNGTPYFVKPYSNLDEAKIALDTMLDYYIQRKKPYYVDNDFYQNEFPYLVENGMYFCIKEREVTEWKKTVTNSNKNNIINFNNYIDIL